MKKGNKRGKYYLCFIVLFGLAGCVGTFSQKQEFESLERQNAEWVDARIRINEGELFIAPGAQQLMNARFDYPQPTKRPEVFYEEAGDRGLLSIQQVSRSSVGEFGRMGESNKWNLLFDPAVRINFDIGVDKGMSTLKIGTLNTRRVHLHAGRGNIILDLRGPREEALYVTVRGGEGALDIYLPRDKGVQLQFQGGSQYTDSEGFSRQGDVVVNEAYDKDGAAIEIILSGHLGPIRLFEETEFSG